MLPYLLNTRLKGGRKSLINLKKPYLKQRNNSFSFTKLFNYCSLLISPFTRYLNQEKDEKDSQTPLLTYRSTSQLAKKGWSLVNIALRQYNLTIANSNWDVPRSFKYGTKEISDGQILQNLQLIRMLNLCHTSPMGVLITKYL